MPFVFQTHAGLFSSFQAGRKHATKCSNSMSKSVPAASSRGKFEMHFSRHYWKCWIRSRTTASATTISMRPGFIMMKCRFSQAEQVSEFLLGELSFGGKVPVDLSNILFLSTANVLETIPTPLLALGSAVSVSGSRKCNQQPCCSREGRSESWWSCGRYRCTSNGHRRGGGHE